MSVFPISFIVFLGLISHASVNEWSFRPANPENPLLSTEDKSFKGTFVKTDQTAPAPTIIVSELKLESQNMNSNALSQRINSKYFEGKAIVLQNRSIKENQITLIIFQVHEDRRFRVIPIYAFVKGDQALLLSMESTLKSYKNDLKIVHPFIKSLKL